MKIFNITVSEKKVLLTSKVYLSIRNGMGYRTQAIHKIEGLARKIAHVFFSKNKYYCLKF